MRPVWGSMEDSKPKNHFFEAGPVSGVLVFVIDEDEPVCLKFGTTIRVKILFDSSDVQSYSLDGKDDHLKALDNRTCDHNLSELGSGHTVVDASIEEDKHVSSAVSLGGAKESNEENNDSNSLEAKQKSGRATSETRQTRKRKSKYSKCEEVVNEPRLRGKTRQVKLSSLISRPTRKRKLESDKSRDVKDEEIIASEEENVSESDPEFDFPARSKSKKDLKQLKSKEIAKSKKGKKSAQSKKIEKGVPPSKVKKKLNPQAQEKPRKLLLVKLIKCEYCEVEFENLQKYYAHRRAEESKHVCGICGKVEPYEAHLIVHMQKHGRAKEDFKSSSSQVDSKMSQDKASSNKSTKHKKEKNKQKVKCNICDVIVSSVDCLKIHTMLHTGECAYRCCVCGENFSCLSSRQHHMHTHVLVNRFKCNPCDQRFASRAELAKHQLTHEIKCALCGEIFPNKTSRTCHYRVAHPNDILKCSLCSSMFATEEDLMKHLAYHKKGKKEQCPVCGVVVSKLKDHMQLHSQQVPEKMFVCDQCPMRYLRKSNLDRHMRTHTGEKPYACNKCAKSFRSNGMLRKHLLTHTQERPYQCEVCGKRCSLRSNLNIHMRVHNDDKYYSCSLCPQAFNHKNSLNIHMRNKHSQDLTGQKNKQLNMTGHTHVLPHPLQPPTPQHLVSEMEKVIPLDPNDQHLQMGIHAGVGCGLSSDMIMKADDHQSYSDMMMKGENHRDYTQLQMQMSYPSSMAAGLPSTMILEPDGMAMSKYHLQPQSSHSHSHGY